MDMFLYVMLITLKVTNVDSDGGYISPILAESMDTDKHVISLKSDQIPSYLSNPHDTNPYC
jgi:hypothetical protein